jgi:hypothetical protein
MHLGAWLCCLSCELILPSIFNYIEQSEAGEYDERKFQKLQEKTDYVRREFNLPDTEDVIQGTRSCRTCCFI